MMSSVYSFTMSSNLVLQSSSSLIFLKLVMFSRKFKKYLRMQSMFVFRILLEIMVWTECSAYSCRVLLEVPAGLLESYCLILVMNWV